MSVSHDHGRANDRWICLWKIVLLVLIASPHKARAQFKIQPGSRPAAVVAVEAAARAAAEVTPEVNPMRLLEVQINGHPTGKIAQFALRNGLLFTTRGELHDLGIRGPANVVVSRSLGTSNPGTADPARINTATSNAATAKPTTADPDTDQLIALSDLPGLTWRLDDSTQTVYLTVTDRGLLPSILNSEEDASKARHFHRTIESGSGVTLNYDVAGTLTGGQLGSSSLLDLRTFTPWGVASSGLLAYTGSGVGASIASPGQTANRIVRLDSAYTFADINTLRRYSLGDFITGGLAWTRPVRLTGVQLRSDFSMRPDLVTFPLPSVSGSAAVPSTINVLTNGNLVLSSQVEAGPFEIPQLPVINGASNISMTMVNALGQQVTFTQPFYASVALLTPGLQTFSAQAGLVRREWGVVSNAYGKLAGIGNYRRGINRYLTFEASAESTPGATTAGGGGVLRVGGFGIFNASLAASGGAGEKGAQTSLGFQRTGTLFSLGASGLLSTRGFQDVAAINGDPVPRQQLSANAGIFLRHLGSLGVAYADLRQDVSLHPLPLSPTVPQNAKIVSSSYSIQFRHLSIYANEFHSFTNEGANGFQAGITIPLGRRTSVGVSEGTGEGYGQVRVQKSAAQIGELGYDAYLSAIHPVHEFGQVQYKSPWGLFTGGLDQDGGTTTLRVESQGAISFVDRGIFPSNTIYDSFAVVDTNGLAKVRVLQENRDVGSTDSKGRLLVPDLRAFDLNHLGINPIDIPLDTTIDTDTRAIRPQDRSGVIVRFPVKVSHGALLHLVDDDGQPLPVGSTATLLTTHIAFPVGYEGETYLEDLVRHNEIAAELPNGRHCRADFFYLPIKGTIPTIGPLLCHAGRP